MNDLNTLDLASLLPSSIADDEEVQALAKVVTQKLLDINDGINALLLWKNLSRYDDATLLHLAWELHTDLYEEDLSKETREQLIRSSILWHMKKGTLYSVKLALHTVFKTGEVEEWPAYGAAPYHFRIQGLTEPAQDENKTLQLVQLVQQSKNLRSWLDSIEFERQLNGGYFIGAGIMDDEEIVTSSNLKDEFVFSQSLGIGASIMDDSEVSVNGSIVL
ncbi:phage tail protein I [Acidaminococcus sp.]|uniref:phage tail protein I n=1 Tax=Acidaminococcus sp. TaxID=1872103 RepID=UPI003D7ECEB2